MNLKTSSDTICAPATGGTGAINIVRLSGPEAINIADTIFVAKKNGLKLINSKSHQLYFGNIKTPEGILDEVLVSIFKENNSYTGEPSVEFNLHASPYILQETLNLLVENGARLAEPGEFSMRAFLNGKMDLAQTEAVADLISATSKAAHNTAIKQLKGEFSNKLKLLRQQLLDFASLIELELDFAEEDIEFADRQKFVELLKIIKQEVENLINSYKLGSALKNGIPVVIIGKPNVGKSTLLNTLLKEDKAIVSNIAGTTRDVIEDTININGILFRFIDTAGIRQSDDIIENLGIEKTFKKIDQANIILLILDANNIKNEKDIDTEINNIKQKLNNDQDIIVIINKIDQSRPITTSKLNDYKIIELSAKSKINIDKLENLLYNYVAEFKIEEQSIITNARHLEALKQTLISLNFITDGFEKNIPTDLISIDVRNAIYHLGNITGQISNDELLGNIFGKFCIGK